MNTVRCVDCGLLAMRTEDGRLAEFTEPYRVGGFGCGIGVLCSALVANLYDEAFPEGSLKRNLSKEVLYKQRTCDRFCQWSPGFSPAEHKTMIIEVERRRLELEAEDRRRTADADREERQRQGERRLAIALVIVGGVFSILSAIVGSLATLWLTR